MLMFKVSSGNQVYYGGDIKAPPPDDIHQLKSYLYRSYLCYLQNRKMLYSNFQDQPYWQWMDLLLNPDCEFEIIMNKEDLKKNPEITYDHVQDLHWSKVRDNVALAQKRLRQNRNNKYYTNNKPVKKEEPEDKYYQVHKDKLNEKFICDCGGCYTRRNKAVHMKSKKHLDFES